ncbi:right-handed parallel beta-helix repeat-containing protein [Cellulophaga sp. E16_2]|uniref:beta strand repeat-containing protein n=1 Tax=Cellulophaga sp. E16_2 TaxID=2789297 RepID=UPI001A922624|nr:Calx-beta domain-containing protein [Cellulophaga sp. E16_2]MBO0592129.1 right-handed parallel beta-helix repeat-containing protein [Cellulophaga sp. E16_2]
MTLFKHIIFYILLLFSGMISAQETFRDNFSTVSYSNNNGSSNFSTDWIETGDNDNGPTSQYLRISSNRLELYYIWSENIRRSANLDGASIAVLSFNWQAISLGGSRVLGIQVSNNGGVSYTTIGTIGDNNSGTFSQDISGFISATTTVRFARSGNNWRNDDYAYIDNFLITATYPAPIPILEINDVTVDEDSGNAVFTVSHTGSNAATPFTVNYQTVNGSAIDGSDYTGSTSVLSFNGTVGDTETITIPILDDGTIENPENFTIEFTLTSDPTADITDTAIGTIIDDDALIMTDGGSATTCSDTFFDPGGLSNYSNNQDVTYTICPDTADTYLNINFTSFEVVTGDILYVYDGNSTGAALIGQYDSANVPTSINSSAASGCLTFRFVSNGSNTGAGWEAEINCFPDGPIIIIEDISFDEDVGNAVFTVRSTRAAHGRNVFLFGFVEAPFTVDFQSVDGLALAGSDYTAVSGTLTFTGELNNIQTISVPIGNDGVPEFAEDFDIEFTGATAQYATVNYNDKGKGTINSQILANDPLTLFQEFDGYYDYSTTGGTLRTSPNGGSPCAVTTSSSNSLVSPVPGTAVVERAYLYWSHSSTVRDADVTFEGQSVSANFLYQTSLGNRNFFGYVSDVTTIVKGVSDLSNNVFDFEDLTINNTGEYCTTSTVLGGWALMVFYEDRSLPAVNINLYQGFDGLSNDGNSFTLDSFYAISGEGAKASFLSWEGDPDLDGSSSGSTNPEELSITNQRNQNFILTGDGGQTGNNSYNSTIYDNTVGPPVYNNANMYGVDLDTYDISSFIQPADSEVTANVDVGQDFVISAAVVLKVPSNLIAGRVFEDVNYPGGIGRDQVVSGGIGMSGAIVELFDSSGVFIQRKNTEANGNYSFGGMADGDYFIKVVSSTVRSTRGNGPNCSSCYPTQTYRTEMVSGSIVDVTDEVGGANPKATQDVSLGVFNNAQSISSVEVAGNGVVGINFGFNFNTIVNTNETGQGSLQQFILNSNTLSETGLDIEANSIFDPAAEEDTSIFMIPPTGDALGRAADANYAAGIFDVLISIGNSLSEITGTNTVLDGRTQTAYSGDSNSGTIGAGGTAVGTSATALPDYIRPEIQIHRNNGDVLSASGTDVVIRNVAVYGNNNAGIIIDGGAVTISNSLLGVNALGSAAGNIDYGIEIKNGVTIIDSNYISSNTDAGIFVDGGTGTTIQNNHFDANGATGCDDNILLADGSGILIRQNLIDNSAALGIDGEAISGGVVITENTITNAGQNGGNCSGKIENAGIRLHGSDSAIANNIIATNAGSGIVISGGTTSGNLISQNSIFANGTTADALGIDLDATDSLGDGVTLNDSGDGDSGPNGLLNFPIFSNAFVSGSNLVIEGWSRPGATIEVFLTDINEGSASAGENQLGLATDYGEGQIYLAKVIEGSSEDLLTITTPYTDVDGNTDNTNKFRFVIAGPLNIAVGNFITSTATISNSTSEFSPFSIIKNYTLITNRRITYRVKTN